jgi:putative two-component system response regulator
MLPNRGLFFSLMNPELLLQAKILMVDDESVNVQLLEKVLVHGGYTNLSMSTDSTRAVSMIVDDDPDLVLLDLHMPNPDGFKILELLKNLVPEEAFLPIIVLTADVTTEAKHRALTAGAVDFLTKPFDNVEVLLRVRNALRTRFLYRQLHNQNALLEERVAERTQFLQKSVSQLIRTHNAGTNDHDGVGATTENPKLPHEGYAGS